MTRAAPRVLSAVARTGSVGAVLLLALSTSARADDKQICIAAAEDGQQSRIDGKLKAAREQFLVCARSACPSTVRRDCSQWETEVLAALPTIVLAARDPDGRDVVTAKVWLDGVPVLDGLDGKPFEVDPGKHQLRVEAGAFPPIEEQVLVREAEKGRALTVQFTAVGAAQTAVLPMASLPSGARVAETGVSRPAPSPWAWVFGGVGLVAVGIGTYLELSVNSDANNLSATCGMHCPHDEVDPLLSKQRVFGPIAFGAGAVSLGLATYYFFARPRPESSTRAASIQWSLIPTARGAAGGFAGRF